MHFKNLYCSAKQKLDFGLYPTTCSINVLPSFEYLLPMIPQFLFLYFREKSTPTLSYLPQGST